MSVQGAEWISDRSRGNSPQGRDSPDGHDGPSQQRTSKKRKVLSCYACRNRKMKCDRVFPVCGRCQKTGRRHECTYDPRLLEESHATTSAQAETGASYILAERPVDSDPAVDRSDTLRWKVRVQERRIAVLEQRLAAQQLIRNPSQYEDTATKEPVIVEDIMFRGKGFKSQFHGATSVMSIISMYHELQTFTHEALSVDHSIVRIKSDFKTFRDRRKKSAKERRTGGHVTDADIFAVLPVRRIVDTQSALYFRTWETSYRILHEPSFWEEYYAFWGNASMDKDRASFAVTLLLIIAITKCVDAKDDVFVGDTTADRQAAHDLIDICENWINLQPRKRVTLSFFQLHCLSLLAKRVNCVRLKQDWLNSGDLLRLALTSGMHRDPILLGNGTISVFDQQMKKRLWITVMELELQSSIESGLQSGLTALYFDTPAPANLADDAFSMNTEQLPPEEPFGHFTSASYLIASLKSLPLRIHLAQLLNTPSSDLQYADVLHFDAQIRAAISALPQWDDQRSAIPSALLLLQLRQYLLVLHKPYARLASRNSRFVYSFTTCMDVCSSTITIHNDLLSKGILSLNNSRNDVIRVGLTLSQVVYHNCILNVVKSSVAPPGSSDTRLADPQTHFADLSMAKRWGSLDGTLYLAALPRTSFLFETLCTSSIEVLERTRQIFEQKVFRLGTGYMEYWLMSAAVGMLPPPPSPATSIAYINNASDDILSRCRKTLDCFTTLAFRVLALQQDPKNSLASSLRTTMASASPSEGRTPSINAGGSGAKIGSGNTPIAYEQSGFTPLNGLGSDAGTASLPKDLNGPFHTLQDMQIDTSSWSFPDFWAFDLGGEF